MSDIMSEKTKKFSAKKAVLYLLFTVYLFFMLYLLFFQRMGRDYSISYSEYISGMVNLVPFRTIGQYIREFAERGSIWAFKNLGGNIILFIPIGIFLPLIWKRQRRLVSFILTVTGVILLVELIQLFAMLGSFDIDDLIFNVLGAIIGFIITKLIWRNKNEKYK